MSRLPAIVCRNVSFSYFEDESPVIKDVNLEIPAGEISVIMGSSGCGKSTLLSVLCGLLPENGGYLTDGEILTYGVNPQELFLSKRVGKLSMMFQNPDLQFCMSTLREELYFCLENLSVSPAEMSSRAESAARTIGTCDLLDRKLDSLSGGEKQRAVLTCIYLLDADCILLDEPFANLDPAAVHELIALLDRLCRERGKTIVAVDHMSDHWQDIADRFILLGNKARPLKICESRDALRDSLDLFRTEGVAYPGIWEETAVRKAGDAPAPDAVRVSKLSIPRDPSIGRKKRLFGRQRRHRLPVAPIPDESLISNASASFPRGRIIALMGGSGSGKTTFLMTLLQQRCYSGEILLGDDRGDHSLRDLESLREKECFAKIGIAFQNPSNQFITQNVTEEVLEGLRRRYPELPENILEQKAMELLERCGLRESRNLSPYMLSQGQQRRLAVLSVLSAGQEILLLDEPTYGQDYRSARALMDLVLREVHENNLTVIMTTHDPGLTSAYADVIIRLEDKQFTIEGGIIA